MGAFYKLSAVDENGNESGFTLLSPENTTDVPADPALAFALAPPKSPSRGSEGVRVRFTLPAAGAARLELLDVNGRRHSSLDLGSVAAGRHEAVLNPERRIAAGVYFVRLGWSGRTTTARVILVD